ncbi:MULTISPECIES: thiamine pyrophosphate-binding protein [Hydrogenophaga]|uniref:Thiamine pyrophosphate enzyme, central domain protein n=1 Tax=Hydrogenophaga intermedia TaxID=65786 RepID=A0A1L1PC06_HYDIT|nr:MULTISPECIES: thiamine pyrophosphate-binding protein [Hydrogenophaga]AOS77681.1 acetolactate synthase [Hydrogenophaga sp. PBC]TMU75832.1 thiamine pyrophosphate-binding protein [Hydrogenophaga intermedia]CDN86344.1 Thiamine pyrophosphate enzyme, central domain protein [Hydrogenophaga intermedia]
MSTNPTAAVPAATLTMSGGAAIARMIRAFGGGPMFGMGGFQVLPLYEAARELGLPHHLIHDERNAVFVADAYAKVSGRVGLADATVGPGATNMLTALAEALNAGTPMVCVIGDTHRDHSWKNMTQESRQVDALRPMCKELIRIESIKRVPELMRRAFAVATTGRPGPVVVDVPEDLMHDTAEFSESDFVVNPAYEAAPALRSRPDGESIARAADLLANAKQPIVLAGGGVHLSGAAQVLTDFARATNIPVAHTLTGKGAIPCVDPLSAGLFGRYDRIANGLIEQSDVVLVVGCKLGEIATKRYTVPAPGKTVIHLDIVAEEFGRTLQPEVMLWGDVKLGLQDLLAALGPRAAALKARLQPLADSVPARMAKWREEVSGRLYSEEKPISVARLITEINKVLPEDGILVADGGFAAHWAGLLFDTKRAGRGFVPDRGFASIGYGLPGAIGAALAAPGRPVFSLTGDSGFCMVLGDLETAARLKLDFTVIVVNNAASGYVKALQHLVYGAGKHISADLNEVNFAKVAQAFNCTGIRVEEPGELEGALRQAMATKGPVVIDVIVTRDPAKMLPGVDSRAAVIKKGDRIA